MTNIPFPMLTAPGQKTNVAGGRLINCYPEPNAATAGLPNSYWRVPGLDVWGTVPSGTYRGGVYVQQQGIFYGIFGNTVYSWGGAGAGTALSGSVSGTKFCWCAVNQAVTPDVVFVSPGVGAFWTPSGGTSVGAYPDAGVGAPDSVTFLDGFFVFTAGNGTSIVSDINTTSINPLNFATAQSKPDALWRPMPLSNGQLLLCGSNTIEVWGTPINPTGYPFSYVATIYRGIPGPSAICGAEDGWGKGIFMVGDDNKVSSIAIGSYVPTPISIPDLDQIIEAEPDKTKIIVGCYVARGHGMVVVQGPTWCWEYDTTLTSWHERQSYLQTYWRGYQPIYVFGNWLCGDIQGPNLLRLDGRTYKEGGVSEVQEISITGSPAGGTFKLSFNGLITPSIAYNATAADLQTALFTLPDLNGNVSCQGGPFPTNPVTVNFVNELENSPHPLIQLSLNQLVNAGIPPSPMGDVLITRITAGVLADPIRMRIETGPIGAFPHVVRINSIEVYMTKGASNALGANPQETNAMIEVSCSRDAGQNWSSPRILYIGRQSTTTQRARGAIWGSGVIEGVRWRFDESAGINFAFMGADMESDTLR